MARYGPVSEEGVARTLNYHATMLCLTNTAPVLAVPIMIGGTNAAGKSLACLHQAECRHYLD